MDNQNPDKPDQNDDPTRTVTRGAGGGVKSDRESGEDHGRRPKTGRTLPIDGNVVESSVGGERANIAGGAVTNDDGVSKGGQ